MTWAWHDTDYGGPWAKLGREYSEISRHDTIIKRTNKPTQLIQHLYLKGRPITGEEFSSRKVYQI